LREDLRAKVKMDKPITMVAAYRSACAREIIALPVKRLNKFQPYKSLGPSALQTPSPAKDLAIATIGKGGGPETQVPVKRLSLPK